MRARIQASVRGHALRLPRSFAIFAWCSEPVAFWGQREVMHGISARRLRRFKDIDGNPYATDFLVAREGFFLPLNLSRSGLA